MDSTTGPPPSPRSSEPPAAKGNRRKWPTSLNQLLVEAIMQSAGRPVTVQEINSYLEENYPGVQKKLAEKYKSIRDTLPRYSFFVRVSRDGNNGCYSWTLDPVFVEMLRDGFHKARLRWKELTDDKRNHLLPACHSSGSSPSHDLAHNSSHSEGTTGSKSAEAAGRGSRKSATAASLHLLEPIVKAIMQSPNRRRTPSGICLYLESNYPSLLAPRGDWHHNIRWHLAKNDFFLKLPQVSGVRGHYYTLAPLFVENLDKGFREAVRCWKELPTSHRKQAAEHGQLGHAPQTDSPRSKSPTLNDAAGSSHDNSHSEDATGSASGAAELTLIGGHVTYKRHHPTISQLIVEAIMQSSCRLLTVSEIYSCLERKYPWRQKATNHHVRSIKDTLYKGMATS